MLSQGRSWSAITCDQMSPDSILVWACYWTPIICRTLISPSSLFVLRSFSSLSFWQTRCFPAFGVQTRLPWHSSSTCQHRFWTVMDTLFLDQYLLHCDESDSEGLTLAWTPIGGPDIEGNFMRLNRPFSGPRIVLASSFSTGLFLDFLLQLERPSSQEIS